AVGMAGIERQNTAAETFSLRKLTGVKMSHRGRKQVGAGRALGEAERAWHACAPALIVTSRLLAAHGAGPERNAAWRRAACSLSTSGASFTLAGGLSATPFLRGITCTWR